MIFAMLKSFLKPKKDSKNKKGSKPKNSSKKKSDTIKNQKPVKNQDWWNSFFKQAQKFPKDFKKIQKNLVSSKPSKPVAQKTQKPYRTEIKSKIEKQWETELKKLENKKSLTNSDIKRKNFLLQRLGKKEMPEKGSWWKLFFGEKKQSFEQKAVKKKQSKIVVSSKDNAFELSLESIVEKTLNNIPQSFFEAKTNNYTEKEISKREKKIVRDTSALIRKSLPVSGLRLFAAKDFAPREKVVEKVVEKTVKVPVEEKTEKAPKVSQTIDSKPVQFKSTSIKDEQMEQLEDRMKTLLDEAQSEGDEVKADNIVRVFDKLLGMVETKQGYQPQSIEKEISQAYTGKKAKEKKKSVVREIKKTTLETDLDRVYDAIKEKGKARLGALSKELNMPVKKVEEYVRILQQTGLAHLKYPPIGEPVVEILLKKKEDEF